jgi:predicted small secreted protein
LAPALTASRSSHRPYSAFAPNRLEFRHEAFRTSLLLLSFTTAFLGACHTIAGAGKDVQEVGEEVTETAEGN